MKKFDAIILSGGKGKRVKKITKKIPKCLIRFNEKPFIYYQLKYLKKNGIKNVIISTGYKSSEVKSYLKENISFINTKVVEDGKLFLGTGGATMKSMKYLKEKFFIIYGDSYLTFNLNRMVNKNLATMAIFKNKNKYDRSNIEIKKKNKILYFRKHIKKKLEYIDYGVSYVSKKIFKTAKMKKKFDLSELYEHISKKNILNGYKINKRFYEIGSYSGIKEFKKYAQKL